MLPTILDEETAWKTAHSCSSEGGGYRKAHEIKLTYISYVPVLYVHTAVVSYKSLCVFDVEVSANTFKSISAHGNWTVFANFAQGLIKDLKFEPFFSRTHPSPQCIYISTSSRRSPPKKVRDREHGVREALPTAVVG